MSKVEELEGQVKALSVDELKLFRSWFVEFDAELWDRQIEADTRSGKLNSLVERALADHKSGRSTVL
jgi:hypothetical protein